jgi:hypothetical protein
MKHLIHTGQKLINDNTDWLNNTEWTKQYPLKYYSSLTKTNINREKELHYKKRKVKN